MVRREYQTLQQGEPHETEQKIVAIMRVLSESSEPLGSITIARELEKHGIFLSERAVRYHLRITDERGFTRPLGRDGRAITAKGLDELKLALAPDRAEFAIERMELLAFEATFDPARKAGKIVINVSLFKEEDFKRALELMRPAFDAGLCVSSLVAVAKGGEKIGDIVVPDGNVGFATVCSVTVNGVLLKAGVPMESRFGGVLEIRDRIARRFTAIVSYAGSSLDPSEAFIRAGMTRIGRLLETGYGSILANFREVPAPAKPLIGEITESLNAAGIGGALLVGEPSEPVCQIRVGLNQIGMILVGGLNPIALAHEAGLQAENAANSGIIDFERLVPVQEL